MTYPREVEVDRTYLVTVDLEWDPTTAQWPFREEEYTVRCVIDAPNFHVNSIGEPVILVHRFGGSYRMARFVFRAAHATGDNEIRIILVNPTGMPMRTLRLQGVVVRQSVVSAAPIRTEIVDIPAAMTSLPQQPELTVSLPDKPESEQPKRPEKDVLPVDKHVDVLILTAFQDELAAVLAVGTTGRTAWADHRDSEGFRYFTRALVSAGGEQVVIAAAWIGEMGERSAAIRGKRLLDELEPSCLAMCGVCAGYRNEVSLGDIIVADQIWAADTGKRVAAQDNPEMFYHAPHMFNLKTTWAMDAAFLAEEFDTRKLQALRPPTKERQQMWILHTLHAHENAGEPTPMAHPERSRACPDWADVLRRSMQDGLLTRKGASLALTDKGRDVVDADIVEYPDGLPPEPALRVHVGAIATVSAAMYDPQIFERLRVVVRNTIGLDMDGTAVGDLARRFNKQCILVKGVQDYAEASKDDDFRLFASRAAAEFLFAFLEKHFNAEHTESRSLREMQNGTRTSKTVEAPSREYEGSARNPVVDLKSVRRTRLFDNLCKLSEPELRILIFRLDVPTSILPSEIAGRADRVIALLEWAEARKRIADVERLYLTVIELAAAASSKPHAAAAASTIDRPTTAAASTPFAFPLPLVDAYRNRKLAILVGSGLSLADDVQGSFPRWTELPERLLNEAAKQGYLQSQQVDRLREFYRSGYMSLENTLDSLDITKTALQGRRQYLKSLAAIFRPANGAPGDVHHALVDTGVQVMLTTNYDELLERVEGPPARETFTWETSDQALDNIQQGRKVLFKIHGTVGDTDSIVVTKSEYDNATKYVPYQRTMSYLLQTYTFMLVGYGINDPLDLDLVFELNDNAFGHAARTHYALIRNPSGTDRDRWQRDMNIQTIAYAEHRDLPGILRALAATKTASSSP